jgi:flagellar M-ring protein FliF
MMNELNKYIQPIKNFWIKLSSKTKKIVLISLGGVVLLAVVLTLLLNRTQYVVLYSGLDHDEAVQVMAELRDSGIDYREDNDTIYVPADKENSVRMQLANEGYPKSAPNYDFFTSNINVMTTDYEKKVIEKYQLNQRLEAVTDCRITHPTHQAKDGLFLQE